MRGNYTRNIKNLINNELISLLQKRQKGLIKSQNIKHEYKTNYPKPPSPSPCKCYCDSCPKKKI